MRRDTMASPLRLVIVTCGEAGSRYPNPAVRQNQAVVINPGGKIIARDSGDGDALVFARIDLGGEKGTGEIYQRRSPEVFC